MDSVNESCAQLSENVSTSSNAIITCELENLFYDNCDKCDIRFSPPAYIQRYTAVTDILTSSKYEGKIRKVVDFGCSELGFYPHLKNISELEQILCVDIDELTLELYKKKIEALTVDFLHMRENPLTTSIYKGSVTDRDKNLENTDAVICIELIEHLYEDTLCQVPANIFGYIKPRVAIVTTPNADFNVLFPRMKGFRHPDHKFEWTRQEFTNWANKIINKYPEYEVSFHGICSGPKGTEDLGCCSQMAIFHRHTDFVMKLPGIEGLFKLIAQESYPVRIDNRSDEAKILDEASYFIRSYQVNNDVDEIPLKKLASIMENIQIDSLREILENSDWEIIENEEDGPVIVCRPLSVISEYDQSEDEADDNYDGDNYDDNRFEINYFNSTSEIEMDLEDEVFVSDIVTNLTDMPAVEPLAGLSYDLTTEGSGSWNKEDQNATNKNKFCHNFDEMQSMCSMFLETSRNENSFVCPENITDPNFDVSITHDSVSTEKRNGDDDESLISIANNLQLTSTPLKKLKIELQRLETENRPLEHSKPIILGDSESSHPLSMPNVVPTSNLPRITQNASDSESVRVKESLEVDFLENIEIKNGDLLNNNKDNNLNDTEAIEVLEDDMNENIH